ncbi:MAG: hypothetical protein M1832_000349 [Thelocarpon impressellum]|nr:MAG: hypothetical protein M1832_000349 [Thelocarpon impressellum]
MFRRAQPDFPEDPEYPADLKELGYFITENDEIKSIADPTKDFKFAINKNERYNEKHREALNTCIRKIVLERLVDLGLKVLRLPLSAAETDPHVPVVVSANIKACKRVVVVFNEAIQDLGIWAYRSVGNGGRGGIGGGSAVDFVRDLLAKPYPGDSGPPGVIIANLGQLLWWRRGKQAVSFTTWFALPRKSAVHSAMRIDEEKNRVPFNESIAKHVQYMFEKVLATEVADDAKIDIVGLSDGALEAVKFLNANWSAWSSRVSAMALGNPLHDSDDVTDSGFAAFLQKRTRAYLCSPSAAGTPIATPLVSGRGSSPAFASGEEFFSECVMPAAYPQMLEFFREAAEKGDDFVNASLIIFGPEEASEGEPVGEDAVEQVES